MSDWQPIGPHRYRIEDDIVFWCPDGEVAPEHAQAVCRLFDVQRARYGYVLWLIDAARSLPVGPDVRSVYAQWFTASAGRIAVAPFRAPIAASTMAALVVRAVQLRTQITVPSQPSNTEAEARAYLASMREQILQQRAAS